MNKNESWSRNPDGETGGVPRRDALKAVAMWAASPLAAQTAGTAQSRPPQSVTAVENRREQPLDAGWRFLRGDASGADLPDFDDAPGRRPDLPRDLSVDDVPPRAAAAKGEGALWGTAVSPARLGPF